MTSNAPSETTTVPTERYERMIAEIRDFSGRLKAENPCSLWNATAHETGKLRKSWKIERARQEFVQELYEKLLELGSTIMGIKKAHYQEAYNEEARTGNGPIQTIEPALEERYPGITLCRAPAEFCDKIGWRLCSAYEVVARLLGKKSAPRETELVIALVDEVLKSLALGIEMAFPEKESKESDTDGSLQAVSDTVNGILSQGS